MITPYRDVWQWNDVMRTFLHAWNEGTTTTLRFGTTITPSSLLVPNHPQRHNSVQATITYENGGPDGWDGLLFRTI